MIPFSALQNDQILREFTETTFTTYSGWSITNGVTNAVTVCGGFNSIFGGYDKFSMNTIISKSYMILVPHYSVTLQLKLVKIDNWDANEGVSVYMMNGLVRQFMASEFTSGTFQCGGSGTGTGTDLNAWGEEMKSFTRILSHNTQFLTLKLQGNFNENAQNESWGIRDIVITIKMCDTSCLTCYDALSSNCLTCPVNSVLSFGTCTCLPNYYFVDNLIPCATSVCGTCLRCHQSCKTCKGPNDNDCLSCESPDVLSSGRCVTPPNAEIISWDICNSNTLTNSANTWTISPAVSTRISACGFYDLLGGYQIFTTSTTISKTFSNLPTHFQIRLRILILKIDLFDESIYINIDGVRKSISPFASNYNTATRSVCGSSSYNEGENNISIYSDHSSSSLTVLIGSTNDRNLPAGKYFGLSRFELTVYKCHRKCGACQNLEVCTQCKAP